MMVKRTKMSRMLIAADPVNHVVCLEILICHNQYLSLYSTLLKHNLTYSHIWYIFVALLECQDNSQCSSNFHCVDGICEGSQGMLIFYYDDIDNEAFFYHSLYYVRFLSSYHLSRELDFYSGCISIECFMVER